MLCKRRYRDPSRFLSLFVHLLEIPSAPAA